MTQKKQCCNILIVDDQSGVRRLLYEVLSSEGYIVDLASNGFEAIEKLKILKVQIIVLDLKMPGKSGIEIIDEIKSIDNTVEIVLMTAYGELQMIEKAKLMGIKYFLDKPFDLNDVRGIIKTIFFEKIGSQENKFENIS